MKIKLIDFGVPESRRPFRPHGNDAGADVYMPYDCTLQPGGIAKIPLGFGIEIADGYAGYIFPRTSMAVKGLVGELPPVDSGYRGEIHAIISNVSSPPPGAFQRGTDRAACDYSGCDCGLCDRSGRAAGNRRLWKYRNIKNVISGVILG